MKRFTALLIATLLIVSVFGVSSAFAGASIGGSSTIYAGKSYSIKVSVTENASSIIITNVSCGGVFSGSPVNGYKDSSTGNNEKITASATIKVSVPAGANIGDKGTITVDYQVSTFDGTNVGAFSDSKTKTYTVGKPGSSTESDGNDTPKATKAPTEWDIAGQNVAAMAAGGAVTVDITKDPKIPASVLSSLKEKQGTLTLNYGGYTCTINGASLADIPKDMDSIDFSVNMEKDAALSTAAGGQDVYQLHFAHSGQLPGKFTYTFKAEGHAPGDTLYLYYYYDQSGVIEGMQSAQVDANGYVSFDVYHCSSYFVTTAAVTGAVGRDFAADANAQALADAQAQITQLQTQLAEAQTSNEELQAQLNDAKNQPTPSPETLTVAASGPASELFGIPYAPFIMAMIAVALVSIVLTMALCRVGMFRKKRQRNREDVL